MGSRWGALEQRKLLLWWGHIDISSIARRLGRTPKAVEHRARALKLPSTRDTETVQQFSKRTGYSDKQVFKAIKAMGMNLHRQSRVSVPRRIVRVRRRGVGSGWAISDSQGEQIVQWLKEQTKYCWRLQSGGKVRQGVWGVGRKPDACLVCRRSDRPHVAKGMCQTCYDRIRHGAPEARRRAQLRQRAIRAWKRAGKPGLPPRRRERSGAPKIGRIRFTRAV